MASKTISFYGKEAAAIISTLTAKDERISYLEQQLADATKQNVLLRDAVLAVCCDPEGFVCIDGSQEDRLILQDALDATSNLEGLVVCDAEKIGAVHTANNPDGPDETYGQLYEELPVGTKFYKARKP